MFMTSVSGHSRSPTRLPCVVSLDMTWDGSCHTSRLVRRVPALKPETFNGWCDRIIQVRPSVDLRVLSGPILPWATTCSQAPNGALPTTVTLMWSKDCSVLVGVSDLSNYRQDKCLAGFLYCLLVALWVVFGRIKKGEKEEVMRIVFLVIIATMLYIAPAAEASDGRAHYTFAAPEQNVCESQRPPAWCARQVGSVLFREFQTLQTVRVPQTALQIQIEPFEKTILLGFDWRF